MEGNIYTGDVDISGLSPISICNSYLYCARLKCSMTSIHHRPNCGPRCRPRSLSTMPVPVPVPSIRCAQIVPQDLTRKRRVLNRKPLLATSIVQNGIMPKMRKLQTHSTPCYNQPVSHKIVRKTMLFTMQALHQELPLCPPKANCNDVRRGRMSDIGGGGSVRTDVDKGNDK